MSNSKLLIFDTNSVIHRAFHALPPLKSKDGKPSGAVYGTLTTFFRLVEEFQPQLVALAFDSPGKTFRHKQYTAYKQHRPKAADELVEQIIRINDIFERMGVAVLSQEGLEADDIVGAVAEKAKKENSVIIVTGDMDILQLVDDNVFSYTLKRGIKESVLYDTQEVQKKLDGLLPCQVVDVKALQGDKTDNIPGVEGVGEKTAITLIKSYQTLENLYSKLDQGEAEGISIKLKEKLLKDKEIAFLSKELATIDRSTFVDFKTDNFKGFLNEEKLLTQIEELGFDSLYKRLAKSKKNAKKEEDNLSFDF